MSSDPNEIIQDPKLKAALDDIDGSTEAIKDVLGILVQHVGQERFRHLLTTTFPDGAQAYASGYKSTVSDIIG